MKHGVALVGLLAGLSLLAGCHSLRKLGGSCHDPKPYLKAQSIAPLQIPSSLDAPDTTNALRIPALNEPAPPRRRGNDPCLDEPPAFAPPKHPPPQA
jgi:uncharacterized lipoprotein